MSPNVNEEHFMQPTTLQEALNIIKFMTLSHQLEISKLKESNQKQANIIKKLETNRKKELEFLSSELQKYEIDLALRTETVSKQLAEKDKQIQEQAEVIEELNNKLSEMKQIQRKSSEVFSVPEIMIHAFIDSNSDSGIAMENEDSKNETETTKPEVKSRKCRRFADSISFLRRVDFSPMKYKPSNRDGTKAKKDELRKSSLDVPNTEVKRPDRRLSHDRPLSDDDRPKSTEPVFSDSGIEPFVIRPKKMNDSMNNHFSDEGSDDSEEVFDRVMARSSIRRSVKANPKYKKINRTKSKLLDHVKVNIIDRK